MTDFDNFADREVISEADARALRREGVLAMDPERTLPLWFDGRYLTARDLNREQNYFLSRQAAIGKAVGRGVVEGLEVTVDTEAGAEGSRIIISAGQGIAFDGAHILLPGDLEIDLADLAVQDALNARLGLSIEPGAPIRSRSGVFVLSLRAVEYTANPTASFPTTVTGERTTHMGDRIEAVAVTLTPYSPVDAPFDSAEARAMAAQRIFQGLEATGAPGHALPLAMLALRNGAIEWLDMHLARRDLVASRRDFLGLGLSRDQLRLSHFNQYQAALADVVGFYRDRGLPARFNAEQHFRILPAAGPLPAACIDPAAQTQMFFPGEIEVELSIVPEDELPYLIDDGFELPPIDLTRPVAERDSLSVMVLAPLPRHVLRSQIAQLGSLRRPLRPISLLGQGPQKPIDKLGTVRITLADVAAAADAENTPATEAWAALIRALSSFGSGGDGAAPYLWYVRRRTLRENADLESALAAIDHLGAVADDVVLDPEAPVPERDDLPVEPAPEESDTLDDEARALLVSFSGLGDLAKIIETQMIRVSASVLRVFKAGLGVSTISANPLAVTALTARIAAARSNAVSSAMKAVEAVAGASPKGMLLLSVQMLGETGVKVSATRFRQLEFFLGGDLLERAAGATAKLGPANAKAHILRLNNAIGSGSTDAVIEVVKEMEVAAGRPAQPQPAPGDGAATEVRAREEARRRAEETARERAARLVKSLPDKEHRLRMARLLDGADPAARNALVAQLGRVNIAASRIATATVLNNLASGARLNTRRLVRVSRISAEFVQGLAALEPHLLTAPAVRRLRRAPDGTTVIDAGGETSVQKRIQLLSANPALPMLSEFGFKHRASPDKLEKAASVLIEVLDARDADEVAVKSAIRAIVRRIG